MIKLCLYSSILQVATRALFTLFNQLTPCWISATAKTFGGQRLAIVSQTKISQGMRKLAHTSYGTKKYLDKINKKKFDLTCQHNHLG